VILIDPIRTYSSGPRGWTQWCHMASDDPTHTGLDELVLFARDLGLRPEWIHRRPGLPHFDLTPELRETALELGAVAVSSRELVRRCRKQSSA
jgi:hypothetical protein